ERRTQEIHQTGYPSPGHALMVGYSASPLRPAGESADRPHRERAVVAFQVAASPAPGSDRSKTGAQQLGDFHSGHRLAAGASAAP
ncbi:MAG TPA: hypothetical protein VJ834_16095, partial [Burkholderiales bacterium]|nr:hypothetical protein [Burkholderiales bacterium]